jgi:DNA-binding response OmpR family regulator
LSVTILVVDDEEIVRLSCRRVLCGDGYEVDLATGGEEALKLVKAKAYDLVILDIMMPHVDGFTLLQEIREGQPEMKFIVITGLNQMEMSVRAAEIGASAYIGKPFDPDELLTKVAKVLEGL